MLTLHPDAVSHAVLHEFHLWRRVLDLAIIDMRKGSDYRKRVARGWIQSDESGIGSFNWICEILGFNPQAARAKILDRYPETTISQKTEQTSAMRVAEFDGQRPSTRLG